MSLKNWRKFYIADKLMFIIPTLMVVYLVVPPLLLLLISTFRSTADALPLDPGPWTLANYYKVFSDPVTLELLQTSCVYSLGSTCLALLIAVSMVWLIERTDMPGRNVVFALILAPIAISGMIKAIGWAFLANPNMGLLNVYLRWLFDLSSNTGPLNIYSLPGMVFVSALSHVPPMVLMLAGAFRNFDPTLEEAGEASGASRLQTQCLITMPLLRAAMLACFIYYFTYGLEDFQIPALLGLNANIHVFSTRIYLATHPTRGLPDFGLAGSYSVILFVVALILVILYRRMVKESEKFVVVSGKGYRPRRTPLGRWKYVAFGGVGLYVLLGAVLPMLILIWVSLQPFFAIPSIEALGRVTLSGYRDLFATSSFRTAIFNTLLIAPIVATATMLLSTMVAWIVNRSNVRGRSILDLLTFINLAIPTIVFGLAILFVYLSIPFLRPLYGTIWILVLAFIARYLTYSTRLMGSAVIQLHKELEEAAHATGASRQQTFRLIVLPLMLPSFLNGWLWVVIHCLREATIAVMLMSPTNVLVSSIIWSKWREGVGYESVAAMSVLVVGATILVTTVSRMLLRLKKFEN